MRTPLFAVVPLILCGCANSASDVGPDGGGADASSDSPITFGDGPTPEAGCVNLQCQVPTCDGGDATTISGTVFDPTGTNPLYDVFVYVPNAPLDAIPDGPTCTQCQGVASGQPIASALTDSAGHFLITHAPAGANIPIVMQLGKWRRKIVLSNV